MFKKECLLLISILQVVILKAQLHENFDSIRSKLWGDNNSKWTIENNKLQSNSTIVNDTFYLSTPSHLATTAQWEFYVNLKFNTSGTNYTDVFLTCDSANLKSNNKNGYFVRIGGSSDEICLYRRKNGSNTKIIDGINGVTNTSNNTLKIKVTRNKNSNWTLRRDITGTGYNYVAEGTTIDSTYITSNYFGILVRQSTASFHKKHVYDDINIQAYIADSLAPQISSIKVISSKEINILFNEYVDVVSSENIENYSLNNSSNHPEAAVRNANNPKLVTLTFSSPFIDSALNTITVENVKDFDENIISSSPKQFTYYAPVPAAFKDLIINEIFADPSSTIGLPPHEFIEIYNHSTKRFSLKNWQLSDATTSSAITNKDDSIYPGEYVILCDISDTLLYQSYGKTIGINSFPSLNNTGDNIYLKENSNTIIDSVCYADSWYKNSKKKEGGWTLELLNPSYNIHCQASENWIASNSAAGGSPGQINSVYTKDFSAPFITEINITSSSSIELLFNEVLDSTIIKNTSIYTIDNSVGNPDYIETDELNHKKIILHFSQNLKPNITYTIYLNTINDCSGNTLNNNYAFSFIVPGEANSNDLVINEILTDPKEEGVDFIEIYNRSEKIIDLKTISVAQFDTIYNLPLYPKKIAESSMFIYPKQYLVISKNQAAIKNQYTILNPSAFIDIASMPTMNISSGAICLLSPNTIIDYLKYNENMHFALLNETKGVSLERIDFNRPSNEQTNWHSASQNSGFATPGYENSQYTNIPETQQAIMLYPEVFSPDEDGVNDVLGISYNINNSGYTGSITIYDSNGHLIKQLVKNELLGTHGSYIWDGINDSREKARIGIYVVFFEAFNLSGDVIQHKKVCVLGGKI
jgi:hypothetical protein